MTTPTQTEYGPEIVVDGVRPEWLSCDERVLWAKDDVRFQFASVAGSMNWGAFAYKPAGGCVDAIKLRADHPYYQVQAHNAKHGTQFKYWPGAQSFNQSPADWDGDLYGVLYRDEQKGGRKAQYWSHLDSPSDIIGYTPKPCGPSMRYDDRKHLFGQFSTGKLSAPFEETPCATCEGTGGISPEYDRDGNVTCQQCPDCSAEPDFVPCERTLRMVLDKLPEPLPWETSHQHRDQVVEALESMIPKKDRAEELVDIVMLEHCPWSRNAVRHTIERLIAQGEIGG